MDAAGISPLLVFGAKKFFAVLDRRSRGVRGADAEMNE